MSQSAAIVMSVIPLPGFVRCEEPLLNVLNYYFSVALARVRLIAGSGQSKNREDRLDHIHAVLNGTA